MDYQPPSLQPINLGKPEYKRGEENNENPYHLLQRLLGISYYPYSKHNALHQNTALFIFARCLMPRRLHVTRIERTMPHRSGLSESLSSERT